MTLRRVLLTGGTGYLGSRLVHGLLSRGVQVGILSRGNGPGQLLEMAGACEFYPYSAEGLEQAAEKSPVDALIHAATCYGRNNESHAQMLQANFVAPLEIFQASQGKIGSWINIGTGLDRSVSPYAMSKHLLLEWLRNFPGCTTHWIDVSLQHFYGIENDPRNFLTYVARKCASTEEIALTDGLQQRDFIHVDDVVRGLMVILEKRNAIPCGDVLEIGSGVAMPVREVVKLVHALMGANAILNFGKIERRPSEPECCVADITRMIQLGWKPTISIQEGLEVMAENMKNQISGSLQ